MSNNHDHNRPGFIRRLFEQVPHSHSQRPDAAAGSNSPPEAVPGADQLPPPYDAVVEGDGTERAAVAPSTSHNAPDMEMEADGPTVTSSTPSLRPQDEPLSERPSRASSVAHSARRARVDDAEDEDDQRETNRQRMHSPPHHDHEHRFHPDMHVHAEEHRQERERQQAQPTQASSPHRPQLYNRISLTFDLLPGFGPPSGSANAGNGSAQGTARAPGSHNGAPVAQGSATPGNDAGAPGPETLRTAMDFAALFQRLREGTGPFWFGLGGAGMEEPDDPKRATRLLSGLEEVPEGLIKRMELVGREQGEPVVCAICFDSLLDTESAPFADRREAADPQPMEVDTTPSTTAPSLSTTNPSGSDRAEGTPDDAFDHKIVVLPCAHAFHASCLRPWFTRPHRTTCPSCRFDIDPDSLTYVPPARVSRTTHNRPPQAAPAVPADTPQTTTPTDSNVQAGINAPSAPGDHHAPTSGPSHPATTDAVPHPHSPPQHPPRTAQNLPFGLVLDFNIAIPGLPPLHGQTQGQSQTQASDTDSLPQFGPPPPPTGPSSDGLLNWERLMGNAQFERILFGGPAPAAAGTAAPVSGTQQQPQSTPPAGMPSVDTPPSGASNGTRGLQSRVVLHSISIPLTGRDRLSTATSQTGQAGAGQPAAAATALPSFEEFMNLVNLPVPPAFQEPPQPQQGAPQQASQAQASSPTGTASAPETHASGQPQSNTHDPHGLDAMVGDLASTLIGALLAGGPFTQTTTTHIHNPPPPPGPIPFNVPLDTEQRGPRPPVPEKRQWTLPPPPGLTLREQVEKKERELGLRCSDISCGLGPSDEDPTPIVDPRTIRQVAIRPLKGKGHEHDRVCTHTFHPACLISAERVAGWSGADQKKDVDGEQEEVEVSCPVCRAVGCISREDWDEGACALA